MTEEVVRGLRHALEDPACLQDRRHVRRGVRRAHAVPLLVLRRGDRGRAARQAAVIILGQRPEPDRAGHRVRLLLRPRRRWPCATPATRPSWSTATRRPSRPITTPPTASTSSRSPSRTSWRLFTRSDQPVRSQASSSSSAGRPHWDSRRRSLTTAFRSSGPHRKPSTWPRSVVRSGGCSRPPACPRRGTARRLVRTRRGSRRRDRLPGPRSAVIRPRRSRHGDRLRRAVAALVRRPSHRRQPRASRAGRPLPRRRRRDRRRRSLRRLGTLPRWHHGAHRGGRHPLGRLRMRAAPDHAGPRRARPDPRVDRGDRARRRRPRPAERAVRAGRRRAVRSRGQSQGVADRAVRVEGHRRGAGKGRGADHGRRDRGGPAGRRAPAGRRRLRRPTGPAHRSRSRKR